jgi:Ca-activated chloride channel family protein
MKIEAKSTFSKVDHSQENEVHAVITLKAPKTEWEKDRRPICIIPVIDTSTSMGGRKIDYAKQSILKLVDNLQPGDYCGLVAFSSDVYSIAAPTEMTQTKKDELKNKVGQLQSHGCTNFSGGMRQALEWINSTDLGDKYILRIIMFTDGQPNQGEAKDRVSLVNLVKKIRGRASVSAFGYGEDCDQELLAEVAKEGQGNYTFIKNPDDALTAFARELGGLLSRYAQDIVIDVAPFNGHKIEEVVSDVDVEEDGGKIKVSFPEILSEEERHIVLRVMTSKQSKALPRALNVLDIKVSYDMVVDGDKTTHSEDIKLKVKFVKPDEAQTEADKDVGNHVGLAKIVQAQVEAESLAAAGNFAGAQQVMVANASWCTSNDMAGHGGLSASIGEKYASQASYTANSGYLRSASKGLSRGVDLDHNPLSADVDYFIPQSGLSGGNSAQADMVENFTTPSSGDSVAVGGNTFGVGSGIADLSSGAVVGAPQDESKKKSKKTKSKSRSSRW